jgi:hypothetical protein
MITTHGRSNTSTGGAATHYRCLETMNNMKSILFTTNNPSYYLLGGVIFTVIISVMNIITTNIVDATQNYITSLTENKLDKKTYTVWELRLINVAIAIAIGLLFGLITGAAAWVYTSNKDNSSDIYTIINFLTKYVPMNLAINEHPMYEEFFKKTLETKWKNKNHADDPVEWLRTCTEAMDEITQCLAI